MKDLEIKINTLSEKIEEMRRKNQSSTKIASIVYIVLVIFVFAYTSTIMSLLKEKTTADSISAQLRLIIDRDLLTDQNREWVLKTCKEQSPAVAESLVEMAHNQIIPTLEIKIKQILDQQVDAIVARLEKDILPELTKVVKEHANDLKAHADDITDEAIANELAKILAQDFDREMGNFINDKVKYRMNVLREELDQISSKPYSQLNQKEAAERRMIVNWVFLMEHHEAPQNVFGEFLKSANDAYESFMADLQLK